MYCYTKKVNYCLEIKIYFFGGENMKIKIKLMVTFMALVLSTFTAISVSAASEDPYQAVIDKLNKEYSMDIHFMNPEEFRTYSMEKQQKIDITPEEFEKNLREQIIENNRAKAEADKKFAELEAKDIIESGSGVCKPTNTTRWSFGQAVECRKRIIEGFGSIEMTQSLLLNQSHPSQ